MKHQPPGKPVVRYAVEEIVGMFLKPAPESWWSIDELLTSPTGQSCDLTVYVRGIYGTDKPDAQTVKVEISIRGTAQ